MGSPSRVDVMLVNRGVGSSANTQIDFSRATHSDNIPLMAVVALWPTSSPETPISMMIEGGSWDPVVTSYVQGRSHGPPITVETIESYVATGSHTDSGD